MTTSGIVESDASSYNGSNLPKSFAECNYIPKIIPSCDDFSKEEKYQGEGGEIYIFNHEDYDAKMKLTKRIGTDKDEVALKKCFEDTFGIKCTPISNKSKKVIFEEIERANPGNNAKFFGVVILSHGKMNKIAANDEWYEEKEFLDKLNENDALKGKLKIIICQVCRNDGSDCSEMNQLIQLQDDNLFIHSTYPEKGAFRDTSHGTFLIQILCKRLNIMQAENDILDELTFIQRDVGTVTEGNQMPVVSHNMKKVFTLKPKKHDSVADK